jgi:hypothetical protein
VIGFSSCIHFLPNRFEYEMDEICVKEGVPYLGVLYDPLTLELEALPLGSLGAQKEVYLH